MLHRPCFLLVAQKFPIQSMMKRGKEAEMCVMGARVPRLKASMIISEGLSDEPGLCCELLSK